MDRALLLGRAKVSVAERAGILLAALFREDEADDREKLVLLEVGNEVRPKVLVGRVTAEGGRASAATTPAADDRTSSRRTATAPSGSATCRCTSASVRAASRSSAPARALERCETGRLALLVLLAAKRVASRLEAVAEKLAGRVEDFMQILTGPEEMLERDRPLRGRDDVDVLLLGPSAVELHVGQRDLPRGWNPRRE
jgi:hypothetical protein